MRECNNKKKRYLLRSDTPFLLLACSNEINIFAAWIQLIGSGAWPSGHDLRQNFLIDCKYFFVAFLLICSAQKVATLTNKSFKFERISQKREKDQRVHVSFFFKVNSIIMSRNILFEMKKKIMNRASFYVNLF